MLAAVAALLVAVVAVEVVGNLTRPEWPLRISRQDGFLFSSEEDVDCVDPHDPAVLEGLPEPVAIGHLGEMRQAAEGDLSNIWVASVVDGEGERQVLEAVRPAGRNDRYPRVYLFVSDGGDCWARYREHP